MNTLINNLLNFSELLGSLVLVILLIALIGTLIFYIIFGLYYIFIEIIIIKRKPKEKNKSLDNIIKIWYNKFKRW